MNDDLAKLLQRYEPKEVRQLKAERQVTSARFSPCGRFLFGGGFDGVVRRWNAAGEEFAELPPLVGHNGWVQEVAFRAAGELLFTADSWGQLRCWEYAQETPGARWSVEQAHDGWIRTIAVSRDGQHLATCATDRKVRVWSSEDGSRVHELDAGGDDVLSVAFHPDCTSIFSGDLKGNVRQWELATGTSVRQFDASPLFKEDRLQEVGGVRCMALNADGSLLACGGTQPKNGGNVQGIPTVLLFDTSAGELKQTLALGKEGDVYVHDARFHPDGFVMAAISGNPGTGKLVFRRPEDADPFYETTKIPNCHSLSLHPNGCRLAVVATNAGSNGNGRQLDKNGEYAGNWSPIHLLDMPSGAEGEG